MCWQLLALRTRGAFCSDRVTHLALQYVTSAVELGPLYKLLVPHLDFLLFQVLVWTDGRPHPWGCCVASRMRAMCL